jgi:hypothetical protein
MTRLRVWVDRVKRVDEPASRADLALLDRAVDDLELECRCNSRRLLVVADDGNVSAILVQI